MILGIIWIKSVELPKLAAVTAVVAASTTKVIWELVREFESVLLVLRDDTRDCLELLDEERLALSSAITVEAIDFPEELAELLLSSFSEQPETSNAMLMIKTKQVDKFFIFFLFIKC